jgi:Uma2 family endonuclease
LQSWAKLDARGRVFDSSAEFILPTGAARSPDASWVSNAKLRRLSKKQLKKFPPLCPEFVVEVTSPIDRLGAAKGKMAEWIAGGVELGWLIDGDRQTIYIYRAGRKQPEKRVGIESLAGEGPVAGFELDLTEIWEGL